MAAGVGVLCHDKTMSFGMKQPSVMGWSGEEILFSAITPQVEGTCLMLPVCCGSNVGTV